jgi:hypothetical protein
MRGNSHVRFLGGRVGAIPPGYPTRLATVRLSIEDPIAACGAFADCLVTTQPWKL